MELQRCDTIVAMNDNLQLVTQAETNVAKNLARRMAGKWALVEMEDLESVLILWLYENAHVVSRYRQEPDGTLKLITALKRKAVQFCTSEQQERSGAALDSGSRYSLQQIERALTAMFASTVSQGVKVDPRTGQAVESWDPSLDDARTMVLDVKLAYLKLDPESQMPLVWKYEQECTYRDLALFMGMSAPGARKKVRKILREIQVMLDGGR
jgi:DNA-directed RNA polymerase specialized sigma24 family protein